MNNNIYKLCLITFLVGMLHSLIPFIAYVVYSLVYCDTPACGFPLAFVMLGFLGLLFYGIWALGVVIIYKSFVKWKIEGAVLIIVMSNITLFFIYNFLPFYIEMDLILGWEAAYMILVYPLIYLFYYLLFNKLIPLIDPVAKTKPTS